MLLARWRTSVALDSCSNVLADCFVEDGNVLACRMTGDLVASNVASDGVLLASWLGRILLPWRSSVAPAVESTSTSWERILPRASVAL